MFSRLIFGKRAKLTTSLAMESNTPVVMRSRPAKPAISRFLSAVRRRRGNARSSNRTYTRASALAVRSDVKERVVSTKRASQYSAVFTPGHSLDPTTTEHQVAGVKHRPLAGSHRALRCIEVDFDA